MIMLESQAGSNKIQATSVKIRATSQESKRHFEIARNEIIGFTPYRVYDIKQALCIDHANQTHPLRHRALPARRHGRRAPRAVHDGSARPGSVYTYDIDSRSSDYDMV